MGAWEQARQGRFDIDFLMIAAAFGAALIGDWPEGALLLFLFTLSGALETFAMGRTRKAIESLAKLRPDVATVRRGNQDIVLPVAAVGSRRPGAGETGRTTARRRHGGHRLEQHRSECHHRREHAGQQVDWRQRLCRHDQRRRRAGSTCDQAGERNDAEQDRHAGVGSARRCHTYPAVYRPVQPAVHVCRHRGHGAGDRAADPVSCTSRSTSPSIAP